MSDKITLYYNPMSRATIAHWMLEESGAPYELKYLDFEKREHKTPEYLQLNAMGKVPTLVHEDTVITEVPAICAYLADRFPEKNLCPPTTDPRRGTYYRWLFFGASCVEAAAADKALKRANPEMSSTLGYGSYDDTFAALEQALQPGPFLLGEQFTTADVYIAAQLEWLMMFGSVEKTEVFTAYVGRCRERDAYQRYEKSRNELVANIKK